MNDPARDFDAASGRTKVASTARGGLADVVANRLQDGISCGRYVPGQRLVEADLTAELGVSRNLLREAFRRLAAEGTIEIVPNKGALVRRLSRRDTAELFVIRMELEALAARLAAANTTDTKMRRRFADHIAFIYSDEPRMSAAAYIAENQAFHGAVFDAAANEQLVKLNAQLQLSLIMAQISFALTADVISASLREHRAIASAILDADVERADEAARRHLARARDMVLSMPADAFRRDLR